MLIVACHWGRLARVGPIQLPPFETVHLYINGQRFPGDSAPCRFSAHDQVVLGSRWMTLEGGELRVPAWALNGRSNRLSRKQVHAWLLPEMGESTLD